MKKSLFLLCTATLILISSCKKENATAVDKLYGKWQWEYSVRDGTGNATPTPGVVSLLILNQDKTYSALVNGSVVSRGTFRDTTYSNPAERVIMFSDDLISLDNTDIESGLLITQPTAQTLNLGTNIDLDYIGYTLMRHFVKVQ